MNKKDLKNVTFKKNPLSTCSFDIFKNVPDIQGHIQTQADYGEEEVCGWFLGTRGENAEVLSTFIREAISIHAYTRRSFHPEDPTPITEEIKKSPGYLAAMQSLKDNFYRLNAFINEYATPFYSMRYQGHMLWETTLPAIIGYFTAVMHNPNNVTMQASTATTLLEWMVGYDLCKMVGFRNKPRPWAHITCDGSVANLEGLWAARELKLFPLGIKDALETDDTLKRVKDDIYVKLPDGKKKLLVNLDTWRLLNLAADDILTIPGDIANSYNEKIKPPKGEEMTESTVWQILKSTYSVNALGMVEFTKRYMKDIEPPAVIVPSTRHYSWPKAGYILGLGTGKEKIEDPYKAKIEDVLKNRMIGICVDGKARMDIEIFKQAVEQCCEKKIPVLLTVAVLGSTEESAVDALDKIVDFRNRLRKENIYFNIHVDAAWGGYQVSTIRKNYDLPWPTHPENVPDFEKFDDEDQKNPFISGSKLSWVYCSDHLVKQFKHVREADSVTIDPHKCGYIPYPAGSVAYRNGYMRKLLFYTAPYISAGESASTPPCPKGKKKPTVDDYSIGEFGVEGSKPGASAAAVFLSHSVIRPSIKGYGKILNRSFLNTKMFYIYLVYMARVEKDFFVVPLQSPPKNFVKFVEKHIIDQPLNKALKNKDVREFIKKIGPDENIFNYAFNFYLEKGKVNKELKWVNAFNKLIYDKLHVQPWENVENLDLMITMTTFNLDEYGSQFIAPLGKALKIESPAPGKISSLNYQRSVVMDPWVAETYFDEKTHMNFFQSVVVPTLLKTVRECVKEIKECMKEEEEK